ncbi:MAG: TonB-dependent receptor [Bacteroidetes bacterium]|jgi:TonB-dependent receptor|nr:TonB-dependent receptor [Bacteroidota bacterium]
MVKSYCRLLLTALITLAFAIHGFAQEGTIRGQVTDAATGEPLMFATVVIAETSPPIGNQTDLDGNYEITVAPGTYDLKVSYVGYVDTKITEVEVKADEITVVDISMEEESQQLEEVVVKASRIDRTENALLALQKKAIGIQDGISAQEISRYGGSNAAESMKRVTGASVVDGKFIFVRGLGDRYTSAQINGQQLPSTDPYRNTVQLDLIPSNLLDNIVASKTFTPDQPGNFTGGNVNLKTKSFPERYTMSFSISTNYNTQSSLRDDFLTHEGGDTDWLGFEDGSRARPSILQQGSVYLDTVNTTTRVLARRDGYLANLLDEGIDALQSQQAPTRKSVGLDHGVSFSIGNQYKLGNNPFGVLLGLNYSRNFAQYENGRDAFFEVIGPDSDLNVNRDLREERGTETATSGGMLNLSYKFAGSNKVQFISIFNNIGSQDNRSFAGSFPAIISGNGQFETRALRWTQRQLQNYQLMGEHVFGDNQIKVEWSSSLVYFKQDDPAFRQFSNLVFIDTLTDVTNPGEIQADQVNKIDDTTFETRDFDINPAEFDLPFHFYRELDDEQVNGKVDITIPFAQAKSKNNKVKFGGMYSQKKRHFEDNVFQINDAQNWREFNGDANDFFANNQGILDFDEERERYTIGLWNLPFTKPTRENSYDGERIVAAGYGMFEYDLPRWRFIGGLRVEYTDISIESLAGDTGRIEETDLLPSFNVVYRVNDNMNIRASGSQTLARPNMRELAPFVSFDYGGGNRVQGNQMLERTLIQNFDLRWELFPRPGELFAVSAYYKDFRDPIVRAFKPMVSNPLIEFTNVDEAMVYGLEFEVRKRLDFITPALYDLKFVTNFSLIESVVDIPEEEIPVIEEFNPEKGDTRQFVGQSPYLLNTALNYNNPELGLDATLAFNVFGDRLVTISEQANPDVFEKARPQVDFSISKRLTERIGLRFNARNLLNPNWRRTMEFRGREYILLDYRRGINFGLKLSYNI